jgi:hypothetical protein
LLVLVLVLGAAVVGLSVLCVWQALLYAPLSIELAHAEGEIETFDEMREQALRSAPAEAVGCLAYTVTYYPSGSKHASGSRIDRIVERARASAVREIIAHLRRSTGEDLGDDPAPWIKKYADGKQP